MVAGVAPCSRRFSFTVWGESAPPNSVKTLHAHGSRLRKELPEGVLAAPKPLWMVQTKLEPLSADFTIEKPALVQAFALVENDGTQDIVQWSQSVALRDPHPHGGDYDQPAHEHEHA